MTVRAAPQTEDKILDLAEQFIQTRGFNGFSYADIASKLRIQKASIHYHFPSKADLTKAVIERYHQSFARELHQIEQRAPHAQERLERYVQLYDDVLREKNRVCLCGMLAADFTTLPSAIRNRVAAFFEENERWLIRILSDGRKEGTLHFQGSSEVAARLVLSALEGAMLVARSYGNPERFEVVAKKLLASFEQARGRLAKTRLG